MNSPSAVASALLVLSLAGLGIWYLLSSDGLSVPVGPEATPIPSDPATREDAAVVPVRTAASQIAALNPNDGAPSVSVRVLDVDRHDPVAGVAVRIEAEGRHCNAMTDFDGWCELAWPAPSESAQLSASSDDGLVLDTPRRITRGDRLCNLAFARTITLFGVVRDSRGGGVAHARVYLAVPRLENSGKARLGSSLLAHADAAGLYRVQLRHGWPAGSHLVAVARPYAPAVGSLSNIQASTTQVDLQFAEGSILRVRVLDEGGQGVPRCRLRVMTASSPLLSEWTPDEVPEGAGGDLGLVSQLVETDETGTATVADWPVGRDAMVRVFNERNRRFCVIEAPGVVRESGRPTTIAANEASNAQIRVRVETRTAVQVTGHLEGFSMGEAARLIVTRIGGDGGNEIGSMRLSEAGAFEAQFSQWRRDQGGSFKLTLQAAMRGGDWQQELGTYEIHGDPVLSGVIIRR